MVNRFYKLVVAATATAAAHTPKCSEREKYGRQKLWQKFKHKKGTENLVTIKMRFAMRLCTRAAAFSRRCMSGHASGRRCMSSHAPVIAVHGGAWAIPDSLRDASVSGCAAAAERGWNVLNAADGKTALDAVEAAVRVLEDDPAFDAGYGSVLNAAGAVEQDAVIIDGRDLSAGAVAALGAVRNPVSVARLVMERTEHVLLVGDGATQFAREQGIPIVANEELVTAAARAEYEAMAAFPNSVSQLFNDAGSSGDDSSGAAVNTGHDTVGAVAMDKYGNLAAATSTGGITFKRVGRVGDSPIIGSGCVADNTAGAISTTGHGESIMRFTLASRILYALNGSDELSPDAALDFGLRSMRTRLGGCGGAILLSPQGELGLAFTTPRMAWAACGASVTYGQVRSGVDRRIPNATGAVELIDFRTA